MNYRKIVPAVSISVFCALSSLLSYKVGVPLRLGFIIGSQWSFFSGSVVMAPLAGAFAGIAGSSLTSVILLVMRLFKGTFGLHYVAYHVPGFFASMYWAVTSRWVRSIPFMLAILLFITHPVGSGAALYAMIWVFALYLTLFRSTTIFNQALGSTLTAHAVGSVIWLYTVSMSADAWLMLIPIACIERLLFAGLMSIAYYSIQKIISVFSTAQSLPVASSAAR